MNVQLITQEDFDSFKNEVLSEIRELKSNQPTRILKSNDVKEMLGISHGKLQSLRNASLIPFSKVDGIIFYKWDEIIAWIDKNKVI